MNKKERLLKAIQNKRIDRIPTFYRGTEYISRKLMSYFKINENGEISKHYKKFLKELNTDFWFSGSQLGNFSIFTPTYNGPKPNKPFIEDNAMFYTLGINVTLGQIKKYNFYFPVYNEKNAPLADIDSPNEIRKNFLTSKLDLFDFKNMRNKKADISYEELRNSYSDIICIGDLNNFFIMCAYLRGMSKFLLDLAFNIKLAEFIIKIVGEFILEFCERELKAFGKKAESYGCWDDIAGQYGLLFSPEIFKRYFLPLYKKLIEKTKKYGLIFSWHCCGSVHEALPLLIDAGIDIFNVVQTSARDMDIEKIYEMYSKKVCLCGAIDSQSLLVSKDEKAIRAEIRKIKYLWNKKGGIILGPSHELVPDTPINNILVLYDELNIN